MEKEIWKPIQGFNDYEINNLGMVKSYKLGKKGVILKSRKITKKKPYHHLNLLNDEGKYQLVRVNRLVASAFVPKPISCNIVNHLDGNKQNNVATNLEWTDNGGNNLHAYETGLRKGPIVKKRQVAKVEENGSMIIYESMAKAARENAISDTSIRRACNGVSKTAGGFKWKYVE